MPYIKNSMVKVISIGSKKGFKESIRRLAEDGLSSVELRAIKSAKRKARTRRQSVFATHDERIRLTNIINLKKI